MTPFDPVYMTALPIFLLCPALGRAGTPAIEIAGRGPPVRLADYDPQGGGTDHL